MKRIVIALGGNALQEAGKPATAESQLEVVEKTSEYIADIIESGYDVVLAHGNGPQVGRIVLQNEYASAVTPAMPFDVCGAMSQGYIGYHMQQGLEKVLRARKNGKRVVTVVTQVVVHKAFHGVKLNDFNGHGGSNNSAPTPAGIFLHGVAFFGFKLAGFVFGIEGADGL